MTIPNTNATTQKRQKKIKGGEEGIYFVEFSRSWRALLRRVKDFTKCGKFSLKLEHLSTKGSTEIEAAAFHMYKVT